MTRQELEARCEAFVDKVLSAASPHHYGGHGEADVILADLLEELMGGKAPEPAPTPSGRERQQTRGDIVVGKCGGELCGDALGSTIDSERADAAKQEREECAQLAESDKTWRIVNGHDSNPNERAIANRIAGKIREREKPPEPRPLVLSRVRILDGLHAGKTGDVYQMDDRKVCDGKYSITTVLVELDGDGVRISATNDWNRTQFEVIQ